MMILLNYIYLNKIGLRLTKHINHSVGKNILLRLIKPSVLSILMIVIFSVCTYKYWLAWPDHPFHNDVDQYYSYLVAYFIHHDFSFQFTHQYWLTEAPNHQLVPKVTMGLSFLYFPFFIIANQIAHVFNYDGLGYSAPYATCIHFGTLFYSITGLWYCRKSLLIFFNEWVTALTVLLILFGTNLFFYVYREGEMSHSYLFFLFSIFMYHALKWHDNYKSKHLYVMAFVLGFVTLIRPTDVLIFLIPLLYNVTNVKDLKTKFLLFISLKWRLLILLGIFMAPILPQLIFWKIHTGQFLFFSYGSNEGFFFTDPKIYSVLFGWRKGWFIYTPIMIFAVIGLFLMFKKWKNMFFPIFIYLCFNIYIISSWWDWGFGGSHGMRALVQSYAFLVFPLAFFINWIFNLSKNWLKFILIPSCFSLFGFFIYLNMFQVWLFKNSLMHWDSMTRNAYVYAVFKTDWTNSERFFLETLFKNPNYEELRKGKRDE